MSRKSQPFSFFSVSGWKGQKDFIGVEIGQTLIQSRHQFYFISPLPAKLGFYEKNRNSFKVIILGNNIRYKL